MTLPLSHPRLEPLERSRLSTRAADAIKRSIVTGTYPPGTRLPTETKLAEQLGVTRLTLREALSQLSAAGFVATRHGSGTSVLDVAKSENLQILGDMLTAGRRLTRAEILSLMEFRAVVMGAFAGAISENVTAIQIAEMRSIVKAAHGARENPVALAEHDYRFNEALSWASGNLFLTLLLRSMREVHLQLATIVYAHHGDTDLILATQHALIDALHKRQRKRAAKVIDAYLLGASKVVVGRLEANRAEAPANLDSVGDLSRRLSRLKKPKSRGKR